MRTAEFAVYLFLVALFPDTLLPASIYGFVTTGVAIVLSGWAGHLVDTHHNLGVVRTSIVAIKLAACTQYGASLVLLFGNTPDLARPWSTPLTSGMFAMIVLGGCAHTLSGTTIAVAVERDWVTTIAGESSAHLTTLNTYMRRIDLFCKLAAPLFVSLLTSVASYRFTAIFLCGVEGACMMFELLCMHRSFQLLCVTYCFVGITTTYRRLPALHEAQTARQGARTDRMHEHLAQTQPILKIAWEKLHTRLKETILDWREFAQYPIFISSLAISWLYLTVLSFDGTMLSYLKSHAYSDPFLAGMRGLNVVAGLAGTMAMPFLEKKVGLVRAGNWSIWCGLQARKRLNAHILYLQVRGRMLASRSHRPLRWCAIGWYTCVCMECNATVWWWVILHPIGILTRLRLDQGMMLSRIGLWAFDLCQLKELQLALATHPRRNSL